MSTLTIQSMDTAPDELDHTCETFWDNSTGIGVGRFYIEDPKSPEDQSGTIPATESSPAILIGMHEDSASERIWEDCGNTSRKPANTNTSPKREPLGTKQAHQAI